MVVLTKPANKKKQSNPVMCNSEFSVVLWIAAKEEK
jgi:hypothetical protein